MKRKIVGIFVMALLITTVLPISADLVSRVDNKQIRTNLLNSSWYETFGGAGNDGFYAVLQAHDGGYIVAGFTNSYGEGSYDAWLVKTDSEGVKEWEKTFGGTDDDRFSFIQKIPEGYIIVGRNNDDIWMVKINENGEIVWDYTYGGSKSDLAWGVWQTQDEGFIISGDTESFTSLDTSQMWIIKTDENGIEQWNNTYGEDEYFSEGKKVIQTDDRGYILIGSTWLLDEWCDILIIKIDANGNIEWEKKLELELASVSISIERRSNGNFLISGSVGELFKGCMALLIEIDVDGNIIMEKQFGSRFFLDSFWYATPTNDGGYIGTGSRFGIFPFLNINLPWFPFWSKICVMKFDAEGNLDWGGSPPRNGAGRCIKQTSDGGYIIAGYLGNLPNYGDGVLFKIDSDGNLP
ncbi:hypothetical protein ACFL1L_00395 [Thermoplasmatota archaeon]